MTEPPSMAPLSLESIRLALDGLIPSSIATCDQHGMPNVALISQVCYVDSDHVALSYQFFNKTRANILVNPEASVQVLHPVTGGVYRLAVKYLGTETVGPIFESMKAKLAGIASHSGMQDIFHLLGADIFRVIEIETVPGPQLPMSLQRNNLLTTTRRCCQNLAQSRDLAMMLDDLLRDLAQGMGIRHAMVLMLDETGNALYTVASLGYDSSGVGSEIGLGQGVIGVAARERTPIRIAHFTNDYAYSRVMGGNAPTKGCPDTTIPLPGLAEPRSQLAAPILYDQKLMGVLFVEDEEDLRFGYDEEDALATIATQLGLALHLQQELATRDEVDIDTAQDVAAGAAAVTIRHYPVDHSVFIGQDYLIKGVAGAIFWKLLRSYVNERRRDFSNRELRLDPDIGLPSLVENLEARLILLQRRLAERCGFIAIEKTGRGRFQVKIDQPIDLLDMPD